MDFFVFCLPAGFHVKIASVSLCRVRGLAHMISKGLSSDGQDQCFSGVILDPLIYSNYRKHAYGPTGKCRHLGLAPDPLNQNLSTGERVESANLQCLS